MKKIILVIIIFNISIMGLIVLNCSSKRGTKSDNPVFTGQRGSLPILKVGDEWAMGYVHVGDTPCEIINRVTDEKDIEGKSCYVLKSEFDPPLLPSSILIMDKATMDVVSISSVEEIENGTIELTLNYSYEYFDTLMYPLEIGKTWKVIETENAITSVMGENHIYDSTFVYINKIEKVEEITVPAGTFDCFKIVSYNEEGQMTMTWWYSDDAKNDIKEYNHETGEDLVLTSYSIKF
ncbi:hypothetical protein JW824_06725 [bacterium]|nr:hypothetical protein [bacterium]